MGNVGKVFEQQFKKCIPDGFYFLRLHDSASAFGMDSTKTRFSMKSPYDFILYHNPFMYAIELKSVGKNFISFERCKEDKKEIHYHQILALTEADKHKGIIAGFVFDFRTSETIWMNISDFNRFMHETNKKSINVDDCIKYGGIIIERQKLKVNYKYNLDDLFFRLEQKG